MPERVSMIPRILLWAIIFGLLGAAWALPQNGFILHVNLDQVISCALIGVCVGILAGLFHSTLVEE